MTNTFKQVSDGRGGLHLQVPGPSHKGRWYLAGTGAALVLIGSLAYEHHRATYNNALREKIFAEVLEVAKNAPSTSLVLYPGQTLDDMVSVIGNGKIKIRKDVGNYTPQAAAIATFTLAQNPQNVPGGKYTLATSYASFTPAEQLFKGTYTAPNFNEKRTAEVNKIVKNYASQMK